MDEPAATTDAFDSLKKLVVNMLVIKGNKMNNNKISYSFSFFIVVVWGDVFKRVCFAGGRAGGDGVDGRWSRDRKQQQDGKNKPRLQGDARGEASHLTPDEVTQRSRYEGHLGVTQCTK